MAQGKKQTTEQMVHLPRQVEIGVADGKTLPQAYKKPGSWNRRTPADAGSKGGLEVDQARWLKGWELESAKRKCLVVKLSLEKLVVKDIAEGKLPSFERHRRQDEDHLRRRGGHATARGCDEDEQVQGAAILTSRRGDASAIRFVISAVLVLSFCRVALLCGYCRGLKLRNRLQRQ